MAPAARITDTALAALIGDVQETVALRYVAIAEQIELLIADGRLVPGTRIPSERALSTKLAVSRTTVTSAYALLRERGYLKTVTGSGSAVAVPADHDGGRVRQPWWRPAERLELDLTLAAMPAPGGLIESALTRATAELPARLYEAGYEPRGVIELREAIAARFERRGVQTEPDQILVTSGALHALDLILRSQLGPGERVLMPIPVYPGALDVVRAGLGRVLPVALNADGSWDSDQMIAALRQAAPTLAYLIPDFHNPTGALIGDRARRTVLEAARRNATTVVVDETFAGLGFEMEGTPCAAIDPQVITIGSLSKSVWGGLRIGWIRASREQIDRLARLRAGTDLSGPVLEQLLAAQIVPRLDAILGARVRQLQTGCLTLMGALSERLPGWRFREPDGGLSLWVQMDQPGASALTLAARAEGVRLVAGPRFGIDGTLDRYLRLPFTLPPRELHEAVGRIAQVWEQLDWERAAALESAPSIVT